MKDLKEEIREVLSKIQIYMNEKLLLDLKESTQRIIELENELNHIYDKP